MSNEQSSHADDEHHDIDYVRIWKILVVLLAISVLGPMLGWRIVTLLTAFGIAFVKAGIVGSYFMHLKTERVWIIWMLATMVAFLLVMFFGLAPDVMKSSGRNWRSDNTGVLAPTGLAPVAVAAAHDAHGAHGTDAAEGTDAGGHNAGAH